MRLARALVIASAALGLGVSCTTTSTVDKAAAPPARFDRALVAKGRSLAAIGNCETCHTARGGKPYAGGYAIRTPFGTVHGTNITPDVETGIGEWSEADFRRALREGLDREGHHLYPAFPYDHFTRLTDEDITALYAFAMTREPVRSPPLANSMVVPRAFVAFWKQLYLDRTPWRADANHDARWNRGAYLADALGHCGACHTPRGTFGAERRAEGFSGGEADGWHAPALDARSPSPLPWNQETLLDYLRTGIAEGHAMTAGPMKPVVENLALVPDEEVRAVSAYIASLDTRSPAEREAQAKRAVAATGATPPSREHTAGARIYSGACADCHDRGRHAEGGALQLPLASGLTIPTSSNLIRIVREGIIPVQHEARPWMPDFAGALDDAQLAALVGYLRSLTGRAPWNDVAGEIHKAREAKNSKMGDE